jgi:hypothetical protein
MGSKDIQDDVMRDSSLEFYDSFSFLVLMVFRSFLLFLESGCCWKTGKKENHYDMSSEIISLDGLVLMVFRSLFKSGCC